MTIREKRLERGWSQEQLSQVSGLSPRTVQRIEGGRKASLESLKCLAAVFETSVSELMEHNMTNTENQSPTATLKDRKEAEAIEYVQNLKAFHLNWIAFLIVIPGLYFLNTVTSPEGLWVQWVIVPWLFAIGLHAVVIFGLFNVFGADWEHKKFRDRMNRSGY